MSSYQLETKLDLGDLGQCDAIIDGTVRETGAFGPGSGYFDTKITRVMVQIPSTIIGAFVEVDVTGRLSRGAEVSIHEELKQLFESDQVGA